MKRREYEQLKRQFKVERDAKVAAAEREYQSDLDALERIWARTGGKQVSFVESQPSNPAPQPIPQAQSPSKKRLLGIRKAIREAVNQLNTEQFNTDSIIEKVRMAYPDLKRERVTDALFRMAEGDDAEFETVIPGKGRRQAVYRVRRRIQDTQAETLENLALRPSEGLPM